jgi:hypothetical protein
MHDGKTDVHGKGIMTTKSKKAIAKGAKTDGDFQFYGILTGDLKELARYVKDHPGPGGFQGTAMCLEMVLERGQFFNVAPLPKGYRRGKQKKCYHNSWKLVLAKEGLAYCEGYVLVDIGRIDRKPEYFDHAWCIDSENNVIDITLRTMPVSYFGIEYEPKELAVDKLPIMEMILFGRPRMRD